MPAPTAASPTLDAVQALLPELADVADETEAAHRLPSRIVDKLRQAGIFRMMVPKEYGGDQLSQAQAVAVIEALGAVDASAAWTAMVGFGFNVMMSRFPRSTAATVYASGPDALTRGALAPIGAAIAADGGFLVNGQWPFASGPYEPQWVVGGCVVIDDGKPRTGPMGPDMRLALVPASQAQFLDTWNSVGLRGSDSTDVVLKEIFVADDFAVNLFDFTRLSNFEPALFNLPFPMLTGPTHSAVCLGIARGALDELATLARTKRSAFNPMQTLGENPIFQHRLAELFVRLASLKALNDQQVADVTRMAEVGEPATPLIMARNASWVGYIHAETVDIVNEAFSLAGSTPVYTKVPLQRRWRDIRVVAQHFGGSTAQYPVYGGLLAGQQPH